MGPMDAARDFVACTARSFRAARELAAFAIAALRASSFALITGEMAPALSPTLQFGGVLTWAPTLLFDSSCATRFSCSSNAPISLSCIILP